MPEDVEAISRRHVIKLGAAGGTSAALLIVGGRAAYAAPTARPISLTAGSAESASTPGGGWEPPKGPHNDHDDDDDDDEKDDDKKPGKPGKDKRKG